MELRCIARREGKLSSFLQRELRCSTSFIHKNKWQQGFFVNGVSRHTNFMVKPGDEIVVPIVERAPDYPAQSGPLEILYEDEALIAIDKPAGMMMHPSFHRNTDTLANYLLGYYTKTGQACAVHPVSRLDRDTFGVVLLAKNAHVHALMCQALKTGQVEKQYRALVFGGPQEDAGQIDQPIARLPKPSLLRQVDPAGKPACTRYQVLYRGEGWSLLQLTPVTGRTHQLRVHCAWSGFPILGDPQYGSAASMALSNRLDLDYQRLCAVQLQFCHPMDGKPVTICSRHPLAQKDFLSSYLALGKNGCIIEKDYKRDATVSQEV